MPKFTYNRNGNFQAPPSSGGDRDSGMTLSDLITGEKPQPKKSFLDQLADRIDAPDEHRGRGEAMLRGFLAGGVHGAANLTKAAPTATRMTAGALAAEGGWTGAAIGATGEGIAEILEGSKPDLARMGVEAGLAAIPFGKIVQGGKTAMSAIRSGAVSGAGEGMRELAAGEELDPYRIGVNATLGGAVGAGVSKFMPTTSVPAPKPVQYTVETTAQTGPGTGVLGKNGGRIEQAAPHIPAQPNTTYKSMAQKAAEDARAAKKAGTFVPKDEQTPVFSPLDAEAGVPYSSNGPEPYRGSAKRAAKAETDGNESPEALQKLFRTAMNESDERFNYRLKAEQEAAAQSELEAFRRENGLEPSSTLSETQTATLPDGTKRTLRTHWSRPEEDEEGVDELLNLFGGGGQKAAPAAEAATGGLHGDDFANLRQQLEADGVIPPGGGPTRGVAPEGPAIEPELAGFDPLFAPRRVAREPEMLDWTDYAVHPDQAPRLGLPEAGGQEFIEGAFDEVAPDAVQEATSPLQRLLSGRDEPLALGPKPGRTRAPKPSNGPTQPKLKVLKKGQHPTEEEALRPTTPQPAPEPVVPEVPPTVEAPVQELPQSWQQLVEGAQPLASAPAAAPVAAPAESALAKFFKTKQGASGQGYRQAKIAFEKGEIPQEAYEASKAGNSRVIAEARAKTGTASRKPVEPTFTPEPVPPGVDPQWAEKEAEIATALGALPPEMRQKALDRLMSGESGAVSPELMMRLGLAAGGALVGGATDPLDDPTMSALAGAGAGFAAPSAARALGGMKAPDIDVSKLGDLLGAAKERLPQYQRFNYLTGRNLFANSVAGPLGSVVTGGLEAGLAGDPRGWQALRELAPSKIAPDIKPAFQEATNLIGKAENIPLATAPTPADYVMAIPGTYMMTGDVVAKNALERAGFTLDEARNMTATNEPMSALGRSIKRFGESRTDGGKTSTFAQLALPFKRTTANLLEQGLKRVPGVGFLAQNMFDTPDPLQLQLVQQGLGGAIGAGSYALGSNVDPQSEAGKWIRPIVSNAAGRYSLPASMGYALGQANYQGKGFEQAIAKELPYTIPLPTAQPAVEGVRAISDLIGLLSGEKSVNLPAAMTGQTAPDEVRLPDGTVPRLFRDLADFELPSFGGGSEPAPIPTPAPRGGGRFTYRRE